MNRIFKLALAAAVLASSSAAFAKDAKASDKANQAKLKLNVSPEGTEIIIDGQRKGTADKVKELVLSPGVHNLDFKYKGDEHTDQVTLKKGVATTFEWKFEDDRPKPATNDGDSDGTAPTDGSAPAPAPSAPEAPDKAQ